MSSPAWPTPAPAADAARELTPAYFSHPSYGLVLQRLLTRLLHWALPAAPGQNRACHP